MAFRKSTTGGKSVPGLVGLAQQLYHDDTYTDLTIVCTKERIQVHKAVVCTRCDFFKAACKKNTFKEGSDNVIDLSTDDEDAEGDHPSVVRLLIEYLYKLDYDVKTVYKGRDDQLFPVPADDDRSLTTHARMFALADKYGIDSLRTLAEKRYRDFFSNARRNHRDMASALRFVYNTTVDGVSGLRELIKDWLLFVWCYDGLSVGNGVVRAAVESIDGLAYDLFLEAGERYRKKRTSCSSCSEL